MVKIHYHINFALDGYKTQNKKNQLEVNVSNKNIITKFTNPSTSPILSLSDFFSLIKNLIHYTDFSSS